MRKLLNKLDKKFGRYGIENLMMYVIGAMAIVYFMDYALYGRLEVPLNWLLIFNKDAIGLAVSFVFSNWKGRITLIIALGNLILFFGPDIIDKIKNAKRRQEFKNRMK